MRSVPTLINLSFALINSQLRKKVTEEKLVHEYPEFMHKF